MQLEMLREELDRWLLDKLVFGVGVRAHHIKYPSNGFTLGFRTLRGRTRCFQALIRGKKPTSIKDRPLPTTAFRARDSQRLFLRGQSIAWRAAVLFVGDSKRKGNHFLAPVLAHAPQWKSGERTISSRGALSRNNAVGSGAIG